MIARTRRKGARGGAVAAAPAARGDALLARLKFDERGLVPVVAQDLDGTVLMLAWANEDALRATLREARGVYWSRSRGELWRKGDTSGHVQEVREVAVDCDGDSVLYVVRQVGPACHTGTRSCFSERQEVAWQTSVSSPSSGRRSSRARPTKAPARATRGSSSRSLRGSAGRSSRKRTR